MSRETASWTACQALSSSVTPHAHAPRPSPPQVARQPIWSPAGDLHGYELLYRTADGTPAGVDRWDEDRQEDATEAVLARIASMKLGNALAFVNVTRGYLVESRTLPPHRGQLVLEVLETVPADEGSLAGLTRLRDAGYRLALDDFTASAAQLAMLPWADYVKIDCRDLLQHGSALVELARSSGAQVIAERVSDRALVDHCVAWGFDLLQGDVLGPAATRRS